MARSDSDIIDLRFTVTADLSLDIERIIEDPIWKTICFANGYDETNYYPELLEDYLKHYVTRERFLSNCVSTNGPGTLNLGDIYGSSNENPSNK